MTAPLWLGLGLTGQALFTARTALQWIRSEQAGVVTLPRGYWELSLAGSLALLVYATQTKDPIFLCGPLVNSAIFSRNLHLERRQTPPTPPPAAVQLAVFGLVALAVVASLEELTRRSPELLWLAVGGIGQALWLARYVLQWRHTERVGRPSLPASFWRAGLAGSLLLLAYAIHRADPVFVIAFVLNPIPYARNLVLLRRRQGAEPAVLAEPAELAEEARCP